MYYSGLRKRTLQHSRMPLPFPDHCILLPNLTINPTSFFLLILFVYWLVTLFLYFLFIKLHKWNHTFSPSCRWLLLLSSVCFIWFCFAQFYCSSLNIFVGSNIHPFYCLFIYFTVVHLAVSRFGLLWIYKYNAAVIIFVQSLTLPMCAFLLVYNQEWKCQVKG